MKALKLGVLDEIKKLMDDKMGEKFLKPKVASVEIEAKSIPKDGLPEGIEEQMEPKEEGHHMEEMSEGPMEMESLNLKGLSDDDKQALKHMYSKMCGE